MEKILNLEKLIELRDKGVISPEEFEHQKSIMTERILRQAEAGEDYRAKSGIIYIVLAWFLGVTGIHNFYAGYFWKGLCQLLLSLTSWLFMFIPLLIVAIWVLGELLFVGRDAYGIPFKGNKKVIIGLRILAIVWLGLAFSYSNMVFYGQEIVVNY